MSISRSLLVSSLIAFAIFQFYQVHSSFVTVFVDYRHHYSNEIKVLTVFNIVGLTISSTLLIVGAIKSKANLLLLALIYLFYKVGFFFWYLRDFYNITIGCEGFCDSNRLWVAYQHIAVFGKTNLKSARFWLHIYLFCSLPSAHHYSDDQFDCRFETR